MPPRRQPRRHLVHQEDLVLRTVHDAEVRSAFLAGEDTGLGDGIAEERERALTIFTAVRGPELMPLALKLFELGLTAEQAIDALRVAGTPRRPLKNPPPTRKGLPMLDRTSAVAPSAAPSLRRRPGERWTKREIAHFGFLVGQGFSGPEIMHILDIGSTAAVANACARYGVALARRRNGDTIVPVVVMKEACANLMRRRRCAA